MRIADRERLAVHLRRNPGLHLYELGDLDPAYWPRTRWWALSRGASLRCVVLLYQAELMPTLLALGTETDDLRQLLRSLGRELPTRLYAHLSPGLVDELLPGRALRPCGRHLKMLLCRPEALPPAGRGVETLDPEDGDELTRFYTAAYPGHWFDPSTLEHGLACAIRVGGRIVAAAGVHVHAPRQGVAAIGNVATDPEYRGRGHARSLTAHLCHRLRESVTHVGLNVHRDNAAAVGLYRSMGFEVVAEYEEWIADG